MYREHGRKCAHCERREFLTVDHIVPVALGGATQLANLRPMCEPHNRKYWADYFASYLRQLDAYLEAVA